MSRSRRNRTRPAHNTAPAAISNSAASTGSARNPARDTHAPNASFQTTGKNRYARYGASPSAVNDNIRACCACRTVLARNDVRTPIPATSTASARLSPDPSTTPRPSAPLHPYRIADVTTPAARKITDAPQAYATVAAIFPMKMPASDRQLASRVSNVRRSRSPANESPAPDAAVRAARNPDRFTAPQEAPNGPATMTPALQAPSASTAMPNAIDPRSCPGPARSSSRHSFQNTGPMS